jgi:hypothetical protein
MLGIYPPLGPPPPFDPIEERRGLIIDFTPENRVRSLQFVKYDAALERWAKEED